MTAQIPSTTQQDTSSHEFHNAAEYTSYVEQHARHFLSDEENRTLREDPVGSSDENMFVDAPTLKQQMATPTRLVHVPTRTVIKSDLLPSDTEYVAISHVWEQDNDSTKQHFYAGIDVETDEGQQLVHNLELARFSTTKFEMIQRVCNTVGVSYMWVDMLCILQHVAYDVQKEIPNMRQYYSNAKLCVIVLPCVRWVDDDMNTMDQLSSMQLVESSLDACAVDENLLKWVHSDGLMHDTWFRRVWTAQEVYNAKKAVIVARRGELYHARAFLAQMSGVEPASFPLSHWSQQIPPQFSATCMMVAGASKTQVLSARDALIVSQQRQSVKIQDRVFGILGLTDVSMQVDYTKTQQELVKAFCLRAAQAGDLSWLDWLGERIAGSPLPRLTEGVQVVKRWWNTRFRVHNIAYEASDRTLKLAGLEKYVPSIERVLEPTEPSVQNTVWSNDWWLRANLNTARMPAGNWMKLLEAIKTKFGIHGLKQTFGCITGRHWSQSAEGALMDVLLKYAIGRNDPNWHIKWHNSWFEKLQAAAHQFIGMCFSLDHFYHKGCTLMNVSGSVAVVNNVLSPHIQYQVVVPITDDNLRPCLVMHNLDFAGHGVLIPMADLRSAADRVMISV